MHHPPFGNALHSTEACTHKKKSFAFVKCFRIFKKRFIHLNWLFNLCKAKVAITPGSKKHIKYVILIDSHIWSAFILKEACAVNLHFPLVSIKELLN